MNGMKIWHQANQALSRLVVANNNILSQAKGIKGLLDKLDALTPTQKTALDTAMAGRGLDPAEVDALRTALQTQVTSIIAALTAITGDM